MKNKLFKMTVVAIASLLIQNTHAQVLQNIAKKAIAKGVSEGVNSTMKNTTLKMFDANLSFSASLTGMEWYVNNGSEQFIKVYKNQNVQLTQGQIYRGNDYSFDILIINDTTIGISHNITRTPHNSQYPLGRKADLFIIKDSVISLRNFESADSATEYLNGQNTLKGFSPMARFSNGNIYDLSSSKKEDNKIIGTYKYFVPYKANFIFAALYFKLTYGKISDQLFNEKLISLSNSLQKNNNTPSNSIADNNPSQTKDFDYYVENGEIKYKVDNGSTISTVTFERAMRFMGKTYDIQDFAVGVLNGKKYLIYWYGEITNATKPMICTLREDGKWSSKSDFSCQCNRQVGGQGNISKIKFVDEQTLHITCSNGDRWKKTITSGGGGSESKMH